MSQISSSVDWTPHLNTSLVKGAAQVSSVIEICAQLKVICPLHQFRSQVLYWDDGQGVQINESLHLQALVP